MNAGPPSGPGPSSGIPLHMLNPGNQKPPGHQGVRGCLPGCARAEANGTAMLGRESRESREDSVPRIDIAGLGAGDRRSPSTLGRRVPPAGFEPALTAPEAASGGL
jgi:hypothetical protein